MEESRERKWVECRQVLEVSQVARDVDASNIQDFFRITVNLRVDIQPENRSSQVLEGMLNEMNFLLADLRPGQAGVGSKFANIKRSLKLLKAESEFVGRLSIVIVSGKETYKDGTIVRRYVQSMDYKGHSKTPSRLCRGTLSSCGSTQRSQCNHHTVPIQ
jgi:hypothetical protein